MIKDKFNPRQFTGKKRIERTVRSNPGISKIWIWSDEKLEYLPPVRGKAFVAIRKMYENLNLIEKRCSFDKLEQARVWRYSKKEEPTTSLEIRFNGPTFESVYRSFELNKMPQLRPSTQDSYRRMIQKYFIPLMPLKMDEFNPKTIDDWINHLKSLSRRNTRQCFTHELNLLSGIFSFYNLYEDTYESPIRTRHRQLIKLKSDVTVKSKDLTEEEFLRFRAELEKFEDADIFVPLATLQYYQALRISEVAGLMWEDIKWNHEEPQKSRLTVSRSVFFPRKKAEKPRILSSFKNGKQNGGMKEAPLLYEPLMALKKIRNETELNQGFIFQKNGEFLTYRQIQHAYDTAFKNAGLPYTGTHIMRHGGARRVYNKSKGDLAIVQQLLGNSDYKSVLVYAKRSSSALNEFSESEWKT